MPYKTKYGTHYHETYGCCGAMEACGFDGLEPCSICCGNRDDVGIASNDGASGTGIHSVADGMGTDRYESPNGITVEQYYPTPPKATRIDDYVMRLANTLLATKAAMEAAEGVTALPEQNRVDMNPEMVRAVVEGTAETSLGMRPAPSPDILADDILPTASPREEFNRRRHEEFVEDFRHRTEESIRAWDEDGWQQWRAENEGLAEYMKSNLRRERPPELSLFIDEEVESLLRRRYEDAVPCPSWGLLSQWQRYGCLLRGKESRWPGYDDARKSWDEETERLWSETPDR